MVFQITAISLLGTKTRKSIDTTRYEHGKPVIGGCMN